MKTRINWIHSKTMSRKCLIAISCLLYTYVAQAQQWDFTTWHRVELKGELIKDLKASVQQQLRLERNATYVDETFTEVGLGYDLPKGFEIEGAYRLSWNQEDNGTFSPEHRYNVDLGYKRNIWKLESALRARFQHTPSPYAFNERFKPDDSPIFVRIKFSLQYRKLKKITPGVEFETFVRVENPNEAGAHRFRYRVFVELDLPDRQEFEVFYMVQTDYSDDMPEFTSVIGLKYAYEWKRPKKKKKK